MTAESVQREPTMEEILASIRRIISEDDTAGGDALQLTPEPEPLANGVHHDAFEIESAEEAGVTDAAPEPLAVVAPPPAPDHDLMIMEHEEEPAPPPEPEPAPVAAPAAFAPPPVAPRPVPVAMADDGLVGESAAARSAGALGRLMGSMLVSSGVTLDDVVRQMLTPLLKDWLDANLPAIVEAEVEKEIHRIRRMAR
jgi:hypothetical protein